MGQAKNRGTYEERKTQALAEGREKTEKLKFNASDFPLFNNPTLMGALLMSQARRARRK